MVKVITELWEVLINTYKLLEITALLYSRDQCKLLQVLLEDLLSLVYETVSACHALLFDTSDHLLSKVNRTLREFNVWVLIDKLLMKETECSVLLASCPLFLVK